jgi:hypothetical protein
MSGRVYEYEFYKDTGGPVIPVAWKTWDQRTLHDFSTGWSFEGRIALATAQFTKLVQKDAGFTGSDGLTPALPDVAYNLLVDMAIADFATLEATPSGVHYVCYVYATPDGGEPLRPLKLPFVLFPTVS